MATRFFPLLKILLIVSLLAPIQLYADALKVAGSTSVYPMIRNIAAAYMAEYPDDQIRIQAWDSGVGIQALLDGRVDVAASSRYLRDDELSLAMKMGIHLVPFQIAHDCIIPVVNRSNPVENLSIDQLRDIYTGKATNWSAFGGDDLSIHAISREPTSGTYDVWNSKIYQYSPPGQHVAMLPSNYDVMAAVSNNRSAIGYIALGYLNAYVKPLSINGTYGSTHMAKSGKYHLSRPLFLFTRGWPKNEAMNFINYVISPDKGQKIVNQTGYIPLY